MGRTLYAQLRIIFCLDRNLIKIPALRQFNITGRCCFYRYIFKVEINQFRFGQTKRVDGFFGIGSIYVFPKNSLKNTLFLWMQVLFLSAFF